MFEIFYELCPEHKGPMTRDRHAMLQMLSDVEEFTAILRGMVECDPDDAETIASLQDEIAWRLAFVWHRLEHYKLLNNFVPTMAQ
ncbi:hypothetical protein P7L87_27500 [Vibrio parahaemolyticus]|nr:hypothetical protein [Vibrio parahaemolyticus]